MPPYTTATAVGNLLGIQGGGTSWSFPTTATTVRNIVLRVSQYIDERTGRAWTSATTSEFHDVRSEYQASLSGFPSGNVQRTFWLKRYPIISLDSVQENTSAPSGESWTSRATGYAGVCLFYAEEGYVQFHRQFPAPGRRNVRFSYTFGVGTIPDDIRYAAELYAAAEVVTVIKRAADQEGLDSVAVGSARYSFGDIARQEKSYRERADEIVRARGFFVRSELR